MSQNVTLQNNTAAYRAYFDMVRERLEAGESVKLAFGGTSMIPTLHASDKIVMAPLADEPQKGDVLLFRYGGQYIVHRLVGREGDTYVMQGDNCYGTERVGRQELLARLEAVEHADGRRVTTDSRQWQRTNRISLTRKGVKNTVIRCLGRKGRRRLRPWYFALLAILMWAPLNGIGIPLNHYVLGLRADHLLHASVFIPCTLFLMDIIDRRWLVWLTAVGIGLLTEGVQYLLPYRGYDVNDLVANTIGVTLGWLVILALKKRLGKA